jgi:uncharacterized protein (TIGR02118 family)
MVKVSVFYPNQEGSRFDMSYYCTKHIPMVRQLLGPALKNVAVEEGIAGMTPNSPAPYAALGHLYFESVAAFQEAFTPHTAQIFGDVPNYTDTRPTIQISAVRI